MRFTSILAVLALFCGLAFGQAETGSVFGTVTDPQGAVVAGAKVTIKSSSTNAARTTTTNSNGLYTFTNLQPGPYEVKVEAANFSSSSKKLDVSVGSRNTVDVPLAITGGSTTVEVTGEGGVQVETQTQQLSTVVSGQQITELPTLTRNAYSLVGIAGNVSSSGYSPGRGVGVNINGTRDASTDILLDGGQNVDQFTATIGQLTPLDSIGEFRVITSNFSAEYGRASGGIVNVSTKSGTNAFHGTVYEFYRGAGLSSNTYDNNANGVSKPNFVRNQFGYSVGGPVVKDKLFFFSSTEWIRVRSNGNTSAWVVDPGFIANCANFHASSAVGDTAAAACARMQSFYSTYGTLKPGLITTETRLVPCSVPASCPGGGVLYDRINYNVPSDSGGGGPRNEYQTVARVDFNWTDKTQMYWRYALQSQNFFAGTVGSSAYVGYDTGTNVYNNNFLWNVTHIWSPSVVSQSKVVFNRLNQVQPLNGPPQPTLYSRASGNQAFSGVNVELPGYLPTTPGSGIPFGGPQNLYQFYQDLSWTLGKHQFRFGGQYVHTRDNRVFGAYETSGEALGSNSGNTQTGFATGTLRTFQTAVNPQGKLPCRTNAFGTPIVGPYCQISLPASQPRFDRANRYHDFAFYGQDSWKLFPRFTLNLGVRWEYYGVQHNNDPSFDSNFFLGSGANYWEQVRNGSVFRSNSAGNPVGGLWTPDYNNWAPRLGFAWDIFGNGKTSLRGGVGMAYERNFGNVTFNVIQNPPNYGVIAISTGDPGCKPCLVGNDNLGPLAGGVGTKNIPKTSLRAPIQDMQTAYNYFWSMALEREIAKNTVVALEYSGSKGVKQYTITNPNRQGAGALYLGDNPADQFLASGSCLGLGPCALRRLNDQFSNINQRGQQGFSFYGGLNLRVQTNNLLNSGLSFVSNYTWSHAIDNTSSTFSEFNQDCCNLGLLNFARPKDDKGDASFDIRHRWVMSGTWDTPWFKNDQNWWKKNILSGWTFAPIVSVQSGNPYTLYDCFNTNFNVCMRWDAALDSATIPYGAHDVAVDSGGNTWTYVHLDPAAFTNYFNPVAGTSEWGICGVGEGAINGCPFPSTMIGRNTLRTPGFWNVDLGLYKNLKITERIGLQLRGEFYNMMNHSNLYVQGSSLDVEGGTLDVIAKRGGFGSTASDERRNIQLGVKLIF
ncbi:MAG: TonB-dependent receptor [Acidobacteriota bacterium]|nr:TonB-dependent receptor [Acidobacteriota bacterium]